MGHLTNRSCARCGKDLEDAASMEAGIGPVCRKLDNALLAQLLPGDRASARNQFDAVMHAIVTRADEAPSEVLATVTRIAEDLDTDRTDWRTTLKRIEFVLSYGLSGAVRMTLIDVARRLGYVALAHVWTVQKGVAGKARVYVADGRVYVQGPRNKAAVACLRAVANRKYHPDEKVWSAPLANAPEFAIAVRTGYPLHVIEGYESWESLLAFAKKAPTASGDAPSKSPVTIKVFGSVLHVLSPYNASFVAAIKSLPPRERAWKSGAWEVNIRHRDKVTAAAKSCYGAPPAIVEAR